jgi:hypothetical protein
MSKFQDEFFAALDASQRGEDDVIYSYGDDVAVEDGILVAVSKIDRVTIAAWVWLEAQLATHHGDEVPDDEPRATATTWIAEHRKRAAEVWNENIGGGVFQLAYDSKAMRVIAIDPHDEMSGSLWLIPNEVGGMTLMFPSDY